MSETADTEDTDKGVMDAEVVEDTKAITTKDSTAAALPATIAPAVPSPDYTDTGVPSFDYVRERIENRFTTSIGATELAGLGGEQDMASLDKKIADRDQAAKDKLAEIREAMRRE